MVDAASTQPLFNSGASAARPPEVQTAEDKEKLSSDFETFLKMLTAQVQNQDPLNPVDSTDYATQLATFSTVEQSVLTNDLLRDISAGMTGSTLQDLSGWIGMEALMPSPVKFDGNPLAVRIDPVDGADDVTLNVRDTQGDIVASYALNPSEEEVIWTGNGNNNSALPNGTYSLEVVSKSGDTVLATREASAFNRIDEIRTQGGATFVRFADGTEVRPDEVTTLRSPRS